MASKRFKKERRIMEEKEKDIIIKNEKKLTVTDGLNFGIGFGIAILIIIIICTIIIYTLFKLNYFNYIGR